MPDEDGRNTPRDGSGDIVTALIAFLGLGGLGLAVFLLFRLIVPAILEAHFHGSTLVAALVAIAGVALIGWAAWRLIAHVARRLKS